MPAAATANSHARWRLLSVPILVPCSLSALHRRFHHVFAPSPRPRAFQVIRPYRAMAGRCRRPPFSFQRRNIQIGSPKPSWLALYVSSFSSNCNDGPLAGGTRQRVDSNDRHSGLLQSSNPVMPSTTVTQRTEPGETAGASPGH
jgi:hypothetical protein